MGRVAIDKDGGDVGKEKEMHKVHAEGETGGEGNKTRGADTLYAGEKEEGSEGGTEDIGRAELP